MKYYKVYINKNRYIACFKFQKDDIFYKVEDGEPYWSEDDVLYHSDFHRKTLMNREEVIKKPQLRKKKLKRILCFNQQ